MDEEQQTLGSPIAGSLQGIRRSVSSDVFRSRVPTPAQPDPQVTSLLTQNSLGLQGVSRQLETINGQVTSLSGSLTAIKENLALSDQLERQRERENQRREAILAEQGLREGKERQIESKIQRALLSPVRAIAQRTQGILERLGRFLLIIAGGWLTDKVLRFFTLKTQGNADAMKKFKIEFLSSLLFFGGTLLLFKGGLGKILLGLKAIGATVLKIGVSGILTIGFKSALAFVRNTLDKFRRFIAGGGKVIAKQASRVSKMAGYFRNTAFTKFLVDAGVSFGNFLTTKLPKMLGFKKALPGAGFFKGARNFLNKIPYVNTIVNTLFLGADFLDRKNKGQTNVQAGLGAVAETGGFIASGALGMKIGALIGSAIFPGAGTLAGGLIGAVLSIVAAQYLPGLFGGVMDRLTGANKAKPPTDTSDATNAEDSKGKPIRNKRGRIIGYEKVVTADDGIQVVSSGDIMNTITPTNNGMEKSIAVSNINNNPEITTISMNAFKKQQNKEIATSSKQNVKPSLNISADDKSNNYIAIAEAEFNMF